MPQKKLSQNKKNSVRACAPGRYFLDLFLDLFWTYYVKKHVFTRHLCIKTIQNEKNPEASIYQAPGLFFWYSDRGSNPGPLPCEGSTLTN